MPLLSLEEFRRAERRRFRLVFRHSLFGEQYNEVHVADVLRLLLSLEPNLSKRSFHTSDAEYIHRPQSKGGPAEVHKRSPGRSQQDTKPKKGSARFWGWRTTLAGLVKPHGRASTISEQQQKTTSKVNTLKPKP